MSEERFVQVCETHKKDEKKLCAAIFSTLWDFLELVCFVQITMKRRFALPLSFDGHNLLMIVNNANSGITKDGTYNWSTDQT